LTLLGNRLALSNFGINLSFCFSISSLRYMNIDPSPYETVNHALSCEGVQLLQLNPLCKYSLMLGI